MRQCQADHYRWTAESTVVTAITKEMLRLLM